MNTNKSSGSDLPIIPLNQSGAGLKESPWSGAWLTLSRRIMLGLGMSEEDVDAKLASFLESQRAASCRNAESKQYMLCKLCKQQAKDWRHPNKPICYSDDPQGNWNCATVNEIRKICYEGKELPGGVDYNYCDDQKYATIKIDEIELGEGWLALWVSWYKNRGGTDALWLLSNRLPPRRPTEEELLSIIRHYKK